MMATRAYEYRHVVGFEETNLVGNVYYVNHLRWQGRCRELFLRENAPSVIEEIQHGLCFVTTRCSCDYLAELAPFDEIAAKTKHMPDEFINEAGNDVTEAFYAYGRPLLGKGMPRPFRVRAPRVRKLLG